VQRVLARKLREEMTELAAAARKKRRSLGIPINTCATQSVTISASLNRRRALPGRSGSRSSAVQ